MELISAFDGLSIFLKEDPDIEPGVVLHVKACGYEPNGDESECEADYSIDMEPLGTPLPNDGPEDAFSLWMDTRRVSLLYDVRLFLQGDPVFTIEGLH